MKTKESTTDYSIAFKKEPDKRQEYYNAGRAKTITENESKKRIQELLRVTTKQ